MSNSQPQLSQNSAFRIYDSIEVFNGERGNKILKKQQSRTSDYIITIELYETKQKTQFLLIQVIPISNQLYESDNQMLRIYYRKINNDTLHEINQPINYLKNIEHLYRLMNNQQNFMFNFKQKEVILNLDSNQYCKLSNKLSHKKIMINFKLQEQEAYIHSHCLIRYGDKQKLMQKKQTELQIAKVLQQEMGNKVEQQMKQDHKFKILISKQQLQIVNQSCIQKINEQISQIKHHLSQKMQQTHFAVSSALIDLKKQQQTLRDMRTILSDKLAGFQSYLEEFGVEILKNVTQRINNKLLAQQKKAANYQQIDSLDSLSKNQYHRSQPPSSYKGIEQVKMKEIINNLTFCQRQSFNQQQQIITIYSEQEQGSIAQQEHAISQQICSSSQNLMQQSDQQSPSSYQQSQDISSSYKPSEHAIMQAAILQQIQQKKQSFYQQENLENLIKNPPKSKKIYKSIKQKKYSQKQKINKQNNDKPRPPKIIINALPLRPEQFFQQKNIQNQNFIIKNNTVQFKGNSGNEQRIIIGNLKLKQLAINYSFQVLQSKRMEIKFGMIFHQKRQEQANIKQFIYNAQNGKIKISNDQTQQLFMPMEKNNTLSFWFQKNHNKFGCKIFNSEGKILKRQKFNCLQLKEIQNVQLFITFKNKKDKIKFVKSNVLEQEK